MSGDNSDFQTKLQGEPFYALIAAEYEGKFARRSGVSYLNHIREGAYILFLLYGYEAELIEAYCLHPLFQSDTSLTRMLEENHPDLTRLSGRVIALCMEYRRIANAYTIKDPVRLPEHIDLGPLESVGRLLTADKIQNKKDFMKHMYTQHDRPSYRRVADRSVAYFDSWLVRLGISEENYTAIVASIEASGIND
jgi:hypothetical protein